jgi:hypothetical protein
MALRSVTRLWLVVLVALCAGGWQGIDGRALAAYDPAERPATFAAVTLVSSLPLTVVVPLDPGLRLVAMVGSDLDADGDLDLVANDGSLDLLVWINDGTGRLTRRYARKSSGWRTDASRANSESGHAPVSAVASGGAPFGPGETLALSLSADGGPRATYERPDRDSLSTRLQGPRAPPLPRLSI